MVRAKVREFIYKHHILTTIWEKALNFRDKYQFSHWRVFNKIYFNYLTKVKGYKEMVFDKKITNGMFKVFLWEDTNTVVKIIRKDNPSSNKFYRSLKKGSVYKEYCKALTSMSNSSVLGSHISRVTRVQKSGGYESPYIKGENLDVLRMQMEANDYQLNDHEHVQFLEALDTLYTNLKTHYQKYGYLSGDWMLYNLVYDKDKGKIVNVDIEGFYTWKGNQTPNNMERIEQDFNEIRNIISRMRGSIAMHT